MSGTKAGGIKARETNKLRHGSDFYAKIGAKGGANGHTGGFQKGSQLAREAGAKGGRKSRRGKEVYNRPEVITELAKEDFNDV